MEELFTLEHLFKAIEESRETRADVVSVQIIAEDMIRFADETNVHIFVETENEFFQLDDWNELINEYFTLSKVKSGETSTEELRDFFDEDMLEFFEEYRPIFKFNNQVINIEDLLNEDISLKFGLNSDS